jgi:hypothetical protein
MSGHKGVSTEIAGFGWFALFLGALFVVGVLVRAL